MSDTTRLSIALADRYRIERELGAGGMATVYLAHDVRHDRRVALKVLRPELSAILGGERFLAEIKTTANLQHPHILSLFDSGEADGLVFYVMPYVDGESLRDRLSREKQLPVDEAVRIAREVADALQYAHQHGIVHRDIKPENILLHGGHAMVADFGIALAASRSDGGTRMTETGMSLGTPHYMAPEQAMGEREITPKADIYALGCVLYEMLTAEPPFVGATAQAIIARVMTEEPRSLTLQRKTVPPHVEAAVRRALEKLPADRFHTAAEFVEALGNPAFAGAAAHRGTGALAPAAGAAVPRLRRAALILPWALLAAATAAAAWGWLRRSPQPLSRSRIVLWEHAPGPGVLGAGLTIAPDGGTIVYVDTAGGTQQLWAKERDRLEATAIAGTAGASGPVFSPDGEWIAFVADNRLKKVPRLGGSPITIGDSANGQYPVIAWLEGGTVLYNHGDFGLLAVHEDGGSYRRIIDPTAFGRGIVSIGGLPGGRAALIGACTFGCPEVDLRVLNLATDSATVLVNDVFAGWAVPGGRVVFVRRDGGVFVAPLDAEAGRFSAPPIPVLEGVRTGLTRADMALSASGMLIYAAGAAQVRGAATELVWVTRAGAATPIEPGWSYIPAANGGLALSPDGRRLALAQRAGGSEDIWIKQLDRGPFTRLTFEGTNVRPEWSADGRSLLYVSTAGGGTANVRARRFDGTGAVRTVVAGRRPIWEVVRTGDTNQLIVRLGAPRTRDIAIWRTGMASADSGITPLIGADGYEEVAPALSPDGRWIAYASNESGRYEVYVRPFPNADGGRWQVSRNGGNEPRWARSGRALFYREAGGGFVSVAVSRGQALELGEQRVLFPAGNYRSSSTHPEWDVAPGDRRFVFARQVGAEGSSDPVALIRVDNWFAELGRERGRRP